MNTETWRKIDDSLAEALEMPAALRRGFLLSRLADDPEAAQEACKLADCADDAERLFSQSPTNKYTGVSEGSRIGPWELIRPLGSGGMGIVWMARRIDGQATMLAAIKLLPTALLLRDSELAQRFLVEKQILARLDHPNIARLLDAGAGGGDTPNFVMEYVDGEPLLDYLAARGTSRDESLRIFLKICDAVQYAHGNLTIHRDLKPHNILVQASGEPKLLDFGVGKILNESAGGGTITLHRAFSIDYASPEQLRGGNISTSTDIYSLGLLLFEMATGQRARRWNDKALGEVLELSERFILPDHPAIPRDLSAVIRKAAMADPELRYRTVSELAADVERVLDGRPVEARPAGVSYHLTCFAKRNKMAVGASAAALFAIATLGTWGWISAQQARKEQAIAQQQTRLLQAALTREETSLKNEIEARRIADQQRREAQEQAELAKKFATLAQSREQQAEDRLRSLLGAFENNLYSTREEVTKLAGGTQTGIRMIERTLAQLQAVKPSVAGRPDHLAIQADAHSFLADLYGGVNSNIGQDGLARQHLDKAVELWEEVNRLAPGRVGWERAGLDVRFSRLRRSERNDPSDPNSAWRRFEQEYLRLAAKAPANVKVLRSVGTYYFWTSFRIIASASPETRASGYRKSLEYLRKTLDETNPSVDALRDVALAHKYLSGTLKGSQQVHHASEALRLDRLRSAKDPADAAAKLDVGFSLSTMADAEFNNGNRAAAQRGFLEAFRLRKDLNLADPSNAFARNALHYPLRWYATLAHLREDWTSLEEALREYDWLASRPSVKIDLQDQISIAYWRGALAEKAADRATACLRYREAVNLMATQEKPHWASAAMRKAEAGCPAR